MKISLEWLSDYIEIDKSAQEISDILSDLGFPIEGIEHVEGDTVIDVEVTSNRGDCLSHIGVARELSVVTGKQLKIPELKNRSNDTDVKDLVSVQIDEPDLCGRYTARVITGVEIGPTPDWMKKRLEAVGLRSVNNVVDATNYAMMEIGQPPHAFDYDTIGGKKIIVRKGRQGEEITSIDETKCKCDGEMLVIADENKPVAIAGVMGGLYTEINDNTTTVLLEEASFDPVSIRTTSRKLSIPSDASFRFERIVDIENIDYASQRCAELIVQVAGGSIAGGVVDCYPAKPQASTIAMRLSRADYLLGIEVPEDKVMEIFTRLGFKPDKKEKDLVVCTVPSWRHDIYREVDLIEEVARCYGYDKIPVENKINIEVAPVGKREKISAVLQNALNSCGFYETINVTFIDEKTSQLFDDSSYQPMSVTDVTRKSANILRGTLIGSLLNVLRSNYNSGNVPCRIYELADTFKLKKDSRSMLPDERPKLSLVGDIDFQQLRGAIEHLVESFNSQAEVEMRPTELQWADPAAEVVVDGTVLGIAGVVSAEVADKMDLPQADITAAELDFESIMNMAGAVVSVKPIPRFPSITRDLSLIVDEQTAWADIMKCVDARKPQELQEVKYVGIYRGRQIPSGKKSLTMSFVFRDDSGTLKHETVDGYEKDIVDQIIETQKAEIRTA